MTTHKKIKKSEKKEKSHSGKKEYTGQREEFSFDDLKILIEKDLKWSQVIYTQNKKIKKRLTMLVVGNYLRLLLIFVPIVFGIAYLFPFFNRQFEQIEPFLKNIGAVSTQGTKDTSVVDQLSGKDIDSIIEKLQEYKQSQYESQQEN